jgi:RNA polymerase sigma-70 factor (ECF subfamily)
MPAPDTSDSSPPTNSGEKASASSHGAQDSQLSPPGRVPTDVCIIAQAGVALNGGRLHDRLSSDRFLNFGGPSTAPVARTGSNEGISDADVMLKVKAGDESAFGFLVQKYRRPLIGFMFRLCHNPSTAEELAQEVFLRVYRSRLSYEPSAKFSTWLYRIATNLAVNHARDTRRERPENIVRLDEPDQETGTTPDLADEGLTAEQQLLQRERLAAIRGKVNALPERQRIAVIMHKYQQMDYRQIAAVMKLSESATKSAQRIYLGKYFGEQSRDICRNDLQEHLPGLFTEIKRDVV